LLDVRQLMGKDTPALIYAGRVRPGAEHDVVAHGVGRSADRFSRRCRPFICVDADTREVSA
jgi:hypothetical protein